MFSCLCFLFGYHILFSLPLSFSTFPPSLGSPSYIVVYNDPDSRFTCCSSIHTKVITPNKFTRRKYDCSDLVQVDTLGSITLGQGIESFVAFTNLVAVAYTCNPWERNEFSKRASSWWMTQTPPKCPSWHSISTQNLYILVEIRFSSLIFNSLKTRNLWGFF